MIALMVFTALLVYLGIAGLVIKWLPSNKAKWFAIAVFILIPTWDEILGRIYLKYLCEMEGGIHVYKTVDLPAEYWEADGRPRFIKQNGDPDEVMLGNRFIFSSNYQQDYISIFRTSKTVRKISDTNTDTIYATHTSFIYFGGWLINNTGMHVIGTGCNTDIGFYQHFLKHVFRPSN